MTLTRYIDWVLCIIIGSVIISMIRVILDRVRDKWLKALLFILKFILMTGLGFLLIASASPFLWKYAYPLMGIYIALLADCICDIALLLVSLFRKEQKKGFHTALFAAVVLATAAYGTVDSQIIHEDHLTFSSGKLSTRHTFVFLSDLHYGSSQSEKTITEALEKIRNVSPEFVVLGGDICDEHTGKEEMKHIFRQLGSLGMPVYYVYGNHDRQDRGSYVGGKKYSEQEFEQAILDSGLIILQDSYAQIGEDIILLGREDISNPGRIPLADLPGIPEGQYVIRTDHSPYQVDEILQAGADLQLSGHTHAGQLFPMRYLYTAAGLNVVYTYRIGSTDLYVSPGIGNWYYPFRNETHCSYAVIDLIPG